MSDTATTGSIDEFRDALSRLKRETAAVVAAMQLGGDRKTRRELARALDACKRRSKPVSLMAEALSSDEAVADDVRAELEQAATFLRQLREFDPNRTE